VPENRITIQVEGHEGDLGRVRLTEFIQQLEALRAALKQTERVISGDEETTVYYRVIKLSYASPATVAVEAVAAKPDKVDRSRAVVRKFGTALRQIQRGKLPDDLDLPALEAYRELTGALKKHIAKVGIQTTGKVIPIDAKFEQRIAGIIGLDETEHGVITGTLEKVNLHNTTRFDIFPIVGPARIACTFSAHLREVVKQALDRYVAVSGLVRYKKMDEYPYAINAEEIEIYPDRAELPKLSELRGAVPALRQKQTSEALVRRHRNEDW
jgi:hypothetical protein